MPFVSITRLRVRSWRFMPGFYLHAMATTRQAAAAPGFHAGRLFPDRHRTFWTATLWDDREAMRAYITSGSHLKVMPKLMRWCDEASIAHWEQEHETLPSWQEADTRMRREGRASKVLHPTAAHADMNYAPPRSGDGVPINRRG
jgi:heme-degrading monooxygenase HmoA